MKPLLTLRAAAGMALLGLAACTAAATADWMGKPLPPLTVQFLEAAPELKGHPAIVEFWATWCPPCRKSITHLNELFAKYHARGLNIVGITEEEQATVTGFRKEVTMEYSVALDKGGAYEEKLGVNALPQAFVLDKSGKVIWQGSPLDLEESTVEQALR